jgi:ribonuclease BN (tRNA processing enzyme)
MKSHSWPAGVGRVAQEAGAKKLVLTHLGPYTSYEKTIEMALMYYGNWKGPHIWTKIVREVAKYYDGPVVLGHDAMIIDLQ